MPNRSSNAEHIPHRSCVVCRKKKAKSQLLRFIMLDSEVVVDIKGKLAGRGYYVCDDNDCLNRLDKKVSKLIKNRSLNE